MEIFAGDMQDKSKGNWITKNIAVMQLGLFRGPGRQSCRAASARDAARPVHVASERAPVSTIGLVRCTSTGYMGWWEKPLDVETSTRIRIKSKESSLRHCEDSCWKWKGVRQHRGAPTGAAPASARAPVRPDRRAEGAQGAADRFNPRRLRLSWLSRLRRRTH